MNSAQIAYQRDYQGPPDEAYFARLRGLEDWPPPEPEDAALTAGTPVAEPPPGKPWGADFLKNTPSSEDTVRRMRDRIVLERIGPSYRVTIEILQMTFRDVRTDSEMSADVSVAYNGVHLFRTTTTLSVTARDRLAKQAADLAGADAGLHIRRAVFAAVEAVLAAEEQIGTPVDLRHAPLTLPAGGLHVARPLWPSGSVVLTSPGDAGKSSIARAVAVSLAHGVPVIPGIVPIGDPRPVLYVAAEDPVAYWHARSIEAICRGVGLDRRDLAQPIELFDGRGRPLHRIARAIAERAADFGAIILDSQQALLPQVDASGNIRDRDSLFWHAVDQFERPTFIIAHPNRADARDWQKADDGRTAGSEVNRDRARMAWRMTWKDEAAVTGTSFRRYTLANTKNNHGPKEPPLGFSAAWEYDLNGGPGALRFTSSDPVMIRVEMSRPHADALAQHKAGNTTPAAIAKALDIPVNTAKSRIKWLRDNGHLEGVTDAS